MKKIIFVNPPSPGRVLVIRDAHRCGRKSKEGMVWSQSNLAQFAANVQDIVEPVIIDCVAENISYKKLEKIFAEHKPAYVVFQVIPATCHNDLYTAIIAKRIGAVTIATGAHAISVPRKIMNENIGVDYVINGEADITIRELVYRLEAGKNDVGNITGITYRKNGEVMMTPPRAFVDLTKLPLARYDLLPLHKYNIPFWGKYCFIVVSRGCPFRCIFCRERVAFRGVYRAFSVDKIVEEVRILKKYGIKNILFHSGIFTGDKRWVLDFCARIMPENIKWGCNTHLRTIDEEMATAMKQAGCRMVAPGIESGSPKILKNIDKSLTVDIIKEKVSMLARTGLEVWGYFMFGLPGENKTTVEETINLACDLPFTIAHFGIATPYYGTKFYEMCKNNGWLRVEKWEDFDQNSSTSVEYPDFSRKEIARAIRQAYCKFYLRPRQISYICKGILGTNVGVLMRILRGWL